MSWERETLAEIKAEQDKYYREVKDDFLIQAGNKAGEEIRPSEMNDFVNYLLIRMQGEGLPAKEPAECPYCGRIGCDGEEECPEYINRLKKIVGSFTFKKCPTCGRGKFIPEE